MNEIMFFSIEFNSHGLNEISEIQLMKVFKEWEKRLNEVVMLNGDYIE